MRQLEATLKSLRLEKKKMNNEIDYLNNNSQRKQKFSSKMKIQGNDLNGTYWANNVINTKISK